MTTALDLITGALRRINSYAPGETLAATDANDALTLLNDLLDTWSTEHLTVFNNNENIFTLSPGKATYTIGNPVVGTFQGTIANGSPTITGVTLPADLAAGSTLAGAGIPTGTTVLSTGVGTITMSANATAAFTEQISYTVPGDFGIDRPLRITNAYTRITAAGGTGIDYPCEVVSGDVYTSIGLKSQPGPWPKMVYYNEQFPLGSLMFWPVPNTAGQIHLWTDDVFSTFANLTDVVQLPQGYARAIKLNLALELAPEYGKKPDALLLDQARKAKADLKALNASPQTPASYDGAIVGSNRADAGWILHGGFQ